MLAEKPYRKITVGDILQEADVSRSTFYTHFETKDALLAEICADLFAHVGSADAQEDTHDFFHAHDMRSIMTHILYHLREQRRRLSPLFESSSAELFWTRLAEAFKPIVSKNSSLWRNEHNEEVPEDLFCAHITATFIECARWWYAQGLEESPELIERLFESLI